MSKFTFLYLFLLLPFFNFAQPINSWPDQDAWWTMQYYDDFGNPTGQLIRYHLDQDTIIAGQTYQQIWHPTGNNTNGSYCCATRQDSSFRVWIMEQDSTNEALLYDFGAQMGDTIWNVYANSVFFPNARDTVVVIQRDTFQFNDGPHLQLKVQTLDSLFSMEWWDGVGNYLNTFLPIYEYLVSGTERLECQSRLGNSVFGSGLCLTAVDAGLEESGFSVSPNPARDVFRVEFSERPLAVAGRLADLQGKVLREYADLPEVIEVGELVPGVYFLTVETEVKTWTEKVLVMR